MYSYSYLYLPRVPTAPYHKVTMYREVVGHCIAHDKSETVICAFELEELVPLKCETKLVKNVNSHYLEFYTDDDN